MTTDHYAAPKGASSPFATAAPAILAAGYSPVTIAPGTKMPGAFHRDKWVAMKRWNALCVEPATAEQMAHWSTWPSANIGVALGCGVVALDIDREELIEPLRAVCPEIVVGKRGRRGETWFFRADTAALRSRGFKDSDGRGLMDLISDGKQTVLPPSIHPDTHEPYYWTTERTLADTPPEELAEITQADFDAVLAVLAYFGWREEKTYLVTDEGGCGSATGFDSFRDLNDEALANLGAWVRKLGLTRLTAEGARYAAVADWRNSGSGRPLAKRARNLKLHATGIKDMGTDETFTPLDLVMKVRGGTFAAATDWLKDALGHEPKPIMLLNRVPKPPGHVKPQRPAFPAGASAGPLAAPIDDAEAVWAAQEAAADEAEAGANVAVEATVRSAYPVEALGPVLGAAAAAIARKVQCPVDTAANSVLSVGCLGAQGLADVRLPFGQVRPISLFFLTVAESGDRKSGADNEAMAPVRIREGELREIEARQKRSHAVALSAWRAEHDKIKRGKSSSLEARTRLFEQLGEQPAAPLRAILTTPDATHEGLAGNMPTLPGALGVFSDEGAKILGGHGFSAENKASTSANLSSLWDSGSTRRVRAGAGIMDHQGRRVALHLMIQPSVATTVAADPVLRGQGLLARFLVAAPATMAGERFWKEPRAEDAAAVAHFTDRVLDILRAHPGGNELEPRILKMDAEAREAWIDYYNRVEREQAKGGRSQSYRDVAGKSAEQAARIAGVLAIFDDKGAEEISGDVMIRACMLADWYLAESIRFFGLAQAITSATDADLLREWIGDRKDIKLREITRQGPGRLRDRKLAMNAIETLEASGYLKHAGKSHWHVHL